MGQRLSDPEARLGLSPIWRVEATTISTCSLMTVVVGRIIKAATVPVGQSWMWTLAFGHHEDRTPTHGSAATREAAMAAFAKSWRKQLESRGYDGGLYA
jgi:hypothetical protein